MSDIYQAAKKLAIADELIYQAKVLAEFTTIKDPTYEQAITTYIKIRISNSQIQIILSRVVPKYHKVI